MSSRARHGGFRSQVPPRKGRPADAESSTQASQQRPQLIESPELRMSVTPPAGANGAPVRASSAVPDLVAGINKGESDEDFHLLARTVRIRWEAVEAAKMLHAMASIHLGDWVRIKDEIKTKRHRGLIGKVVERQDDAIVICLGEHITGDHRHIRCSPLAIDKLSAPPE